ncbi:MAG TPA: hypothetical protein ENK42_07040 [Deltaproteobacteria bacterium]|nr:hypothetical protein [Deltaproteobacteria bacterium]
MEETGTVIEVRGDTVLIRTEKKSACESCASREVCHSVSEKDVVLEALNPIGAKKGDRVVFTVHATTLVKAGLLVYLFPLAGFIAGVVAGQLLGDALPAIDKDLLSALLGFGLMGVVFVVVNLYSRKKERLKEYMPRVVRIL